MVHPVLQQALEPFCGPFALSKSPQLVLVSVGRRAATVIMFKPHVIAAEFIEHALCHIYNNSLWFELVVNIASISAGSTPSLEWN